MYGRTSSRQLMSILRSIATCFWYALDQVCTSVGDWRGVWDNNLLQTTVYSITILSSPRQNCIIWHTDWFVTRHHIVTAAFKIVSVPDNSSPSKNANKMSSKLVYHITRYLLSPFQPGLSYRVRQMHHYWLISSYYHWSYQVIQGSKKKWFFYHDKSGHVDFADGRYWQGYHLDCCVWPDSFS